MPATVRSEELGLMDTGERKAIVQSLIRRALAPNPEEREIAVTVIHFFEARYGYRTSEMVSRLQSGQIPETADISNWLFWVDVLERSDR